MFAEFWMFHSPSGGGGGSNHDDNNNNNNGGGDMPLFNTADTPPAAMHDNNTTTTTTTTTTTSNDSMSDVGGGASSLLPIMSMRFHLTQIPFRISGGGPPRYSFPAHLIDSLVSTISNIQVHLVYSFLFSCCYIV